MFPPTGASITPFYSLFCRLSIRARHETDIKFEVSGGGSDQKHTFNMLQTWFLKIFWSQFRAWHKVASTIMMGVV
jgi:hypothetical protein